MQIAINENYLSQTSLLSFIVILNNYNFKIRNFVFFSVKTRIWKWIFQLFPINYCIRFKYLLSLLNSKWWLYFSFFKIYLFYFIYLFLAMLGLSCGTRDLRWGVQASLSSCGMQAPGHGLCSLRHTGSLVEVRELSSCGARAQLPRSTWDLSSLTRDRTRLPCILRWILYHWTTREVPVALF